MRPNKYFLFEYVNILITEIKLKKIKKYICILSYFVIQ